MTKLPAIPADLLKLMAEIGPKWADDTKGHVRLMVEKFSEILKSSQKEGIRVETVSYGPHERQAFEIFHPADAGSALRPGLIFVHGGAFTPASQRPLARHLW